MSTTSKTLGNVVKTGSKIRSSHGGYLMAVLYAPCSARCEKIMEKVA